MITPNVYMLMSVARSQAVAAKIEAPHVWYCTHLLGSRMCVFANAKAMAESATWPGDLVTEDAHAAEKWLAQPPEQHKLGIAPVRSKDAPEPPPPKPAAVTRACVGIRWWVNMVRVADPALLREVRRTKFHDFVEVETIFPGALDGLNPDHWCLCECGRALNIKHDERSATHCPPGIGCTVENDNE